MNYSRKNFAVALPLVLAMGWSSVAHAELPTGVRAMIDAAIATGDKGKIETVIALAHSTQPDNTAEIDQIAEQWRQSQKQAADLTKQKEIETIRSAGLFERWKGEGEFGAFQSSGNSDNVGVSAGLKLDRKGVDWTHLLRGRADYQESNGVKSREQFFASYEPRFQINEALFAYGLAQFERDRLQGFDGRYAVSGGLGYKVLDGEALKLAVKAGPAYRVTDFTTGDSENRLAGLAGFDFDWKIADRLSFSQDANMVAETGSAGQVIIDSSTTSVNLVTGLDAKISDKLRTRLSYAVDYDSNPPVGAVKTDTMTRFSVVYGF